MEWKRKLSSRKLWMAIIGFVTAICIMTNLDQGSIEKITAMVMAFGELIAYILAEGWADGSRGE